MYNFTCTGARGYSIELSNLFMCVNGDDTLKNLYVTVEDVTEVELSGDLAVSQQDYNKQDIFPLKTAQWKWSWSSLMLLSMPKSMPNRLMSTSSPSWTPHPDILPGSASTPIPARNPLSCLWWVLIKMDQYQLVRSSGFFSFPAVTC